MTVFEFAGQGFWSWAKLRPSDNPWQGGQSVATLVAALVRMCLGSQCGVWGELMDLVLRGVKSLSAPLFPSPLRNPSCSMFCPRLPRGGHPPPACVRWSYWYIFTWQYERRFSSLPTRYNLLLWTSEYALWSFKSLLKNGRRGLEGGLLSLWNTLVLTTWISRDFYISTRSKVTALHFVHYWMCL